MSRIASVGSKGRGGGLAASSIDYGLEENATKQVINESKDDDNGGMTPTSFSLKLKTLQTDVDRLTTFVASIQDGAANKQQ